MKAKGQLEDDDYFKQSEKRKTEKRELELQKQQLVKPDTSLEADVRFGISLIKELPTLWRELEAGELRVLKGLLFPQNLRYCRPKFKTVELAPIYNVKHTSERENELVRVYLAARTYFESQSD